MRLLAGWAIAFAFGVVTAGQAQTPPSTKAERLRQAAFAPDYAPRRPASVTGVDDFSAIADRQQFTADGRPIGWRTETATLRQTARGSVDTLRLSLGGAGRTPADIFGDPAKAQFDADAYEIAVTRDWAPMRFDAGDYDVELTPHTGIGVASSGGQAEAGATLTLGQKRDAAVASRLHDLGVRDGSAYGDQGRWYLFAAASGRAVGLNILRNEKSGWDRDGWSTDPSSALVGDAHVGIAWRKGAMQTSLGYIHREVKGEHMVYGQDTKEDSVVAFSFSIKPKE